MRFAYLKYRLKKMGCYLLIIILLPYIITVFLSGPGAYGASRVDETMVNVKADGEKSGSDGGKQEDSNAENVDKIQMPLSEYCIGIMAREIPAVYEEEALKTQAVLVRTQVCLALGAGADTILEERYWTKKDMQDSWGADQYSKYYKRLEHAWEETNGQVLTYENALAKTPFCRLSNGSTSPLRTVKRSASKSRRPGRGKKHSRLYRTADKVLQRGRMQRIYGITKRWNTSKPCRLYDKKIKNVYNWGRSKNEVLLRPQLKEKS